MERISGWDVFTLHGVTVRLHASLLFLLLYVTFIAMVQFPFVIQSAGMNIDAVTGTPLTWAILFSVSLVISVFIHEFGHVLVAQAQGQQVKRITLMMLGGVSEIEKFPEKPSTEFKIAIIGPMVSLVLAFTLLWIREITSLPNVDFYCFWLGRTNLVLAIFNLLPAFPTDGGRVLRSILASRQGYLRGTRNAVWVSHIFAWIFGIMGFIQYNFLLILIAIFIYGAAKSELFILLGKTVLKGMKARDLMVSVGRVSGEATVAAAARQMLESGSFLLSVNGEREPYSFITAELIRKIPKKNWDTTFVKDVRVGHHKAVQADDPLDEVLMIGLSEEGAPVVEKNKMVGLIRPADLIAAIKLRQLAAD